MRGKITQWKYLWNFLNFLIKVFIVLLLVIVSIDLHLLYPRVGLSFDVFAKSGNIHLVKNVRMRGKYGPEKTPYLDTFHAVISFFGWFSGFLMFLGGMERDQAKLAQRRCYNVVTTLWQGRKYSYS